MALGLKKTTITTVSVEGTINPGQILTVDSFIFADFKSCKFHVGYWNTTQNKFKSFDFNVVRKQTDSDDTVFGVLGSNMLVEISSQVVGPDLKIVIRNNEAFVVSFKMVKLNL